MPPPPTFQAVALPGNFVAPTHSSTCPYSWTLDCAWAELAASKPNIPAATVALAAALNARFTGGFMDSPVVLTLNGYLAVALLRLRTVLIDVRYACAWLRAGPSLRIIFLDKNNFPYAVYSDLNTLHAAHFYGGRCRPIRKAFERTLGLPVDGPRCYMPRRSRAICIQATLRTR